MLCIFSNMHLIERALADAAEGHLVPREHYAVELRPVIGLRIVVGPPEGPDRPSVALRREQARGEGPFLAE